MMYVQGVDPRPFLRPPELRIVPPPQPGDRARRLPVELEDGRAAIIAFLRHTGCPFAEATMQMLREAARHSPEVQFLAITHAPVQATERWCRAVGGDDGVLVASDPSRRVYAEWGL